MEACWAHNPEVRGSKPRSANHTFYLEILASDSAAETSILWKLEEFDRH